MKRLGKVGLIVVLIAAIGAAIGVRTVESPSTAAEPAKAARLPRLLDLGSKKCIPCKRMAPILAELKKEYAGKFDVEFVDVWLARNAAVARKHGIRLIPTQIFFDAKGKERWRHEGFLGKGAILAKWKELGIDFRGGSPKVERWAPAKADTRPKGEICTLCDGDIDARAAVVVKTLKGDVRLCGPRCYFVLYSALTQDKSGLASKVSVTDCASGKLVGATEAAYLYGLDAKTGRPWVKAFADRAGAVKERASAGGSVVGFAVLQKKELSCRCGFCDRAVCPEESALVKAGGVTTWGCCPHCALGVAARTGKDILVHQPDALTGEMIVVKTLNGSVASLEPATAVAWFGMRKKPDGTWGSAGCFHQANFVSVANLKKWLEQHPYETGKLISIQQALAAKMKMTPQQIAKACKIGQCAPK